MGDVVMTDEENRLYRRIQELEGRLEASRDMVDKRNAEILQLKEKCASMERICHDALSGSSIPELSSQLDTLKTQLHYSRDTVARLHGEVYRLQSIQGTLSDRLLEREDQIDQFKVRGDKIINTLELAIRAKND